MRKRIPIESFNEKWVLDPTGCWLWTSPLLKSGYGQFWTNGKHVRAHCFAYTHFIGPIPEGLVVDHVKDRGCTSTACVNPAHLEAVTQRVNTLRGDTIAAMHAAKTHCVNGHPFDEENTYHRPDGGRDCRACRIIRVRKCRGRVDKQALSL